MNKKISAYPIPAVCDYCKSKVIFTSNAKIYGREYGNGRCYKCTNCDAYVGVHNGTNIPLGRLANKELRKLKTQCHTLFDPLWQKNRCINRDRVYGQLAIRLGIPKEECHFGWFGKEMLIKCLEILSDPKWYKGAPRIFMAETGRRMSV